MTEPAAVIDFGTRSLRILIARMEPDGKPRILFSKGSEHHLSDFLKGGELNGEGVKSFQNLLDESLAQTRTFGIKKPLLVATALFRKIRTGEKLFQPYKNWIDLQVLTPEMEAGFSFLGALYRHQNEFVQGEKITLVDQGGGSTQIVQGKLHPRGVQIEKIYPLPFGSKDLLSHGEDGETPDTLQEIQEKTRLNLKRLFPLEELKKGGATKIFGLGTALKRVFSLIAFQKGEPWEYEEISFAGQRILLKNLGELEVFLLQRAHLPVTEKGEIPEVFKPQELVHSLEFFKKILTSLEQRDIIISGWGLRYGALLFRMGYTIDFP